MICYKITRNVWLDRERTQKGHCSFNVLNASPWRILYSQEKWTKAYYGFLFAFDNKSSAIQYLDDLCIHEEYFSIWEAECIHPMPAPEWLPDNISEYKDFWVSSALYNSRQHSMFAPPRHTIITPKLRLLRLIPEFIGKDGWKLAEFYDPQP